MGDNDNVVGEYMEYCDLCGRIVGDREAVKALEAKVDGLLVKWREHQGKGTKESVYALFHYIEGEFGGVPIDATERTDD